MNLKYEPRYDLLSVWLGAPEPVENVEVEPGVCVRVSRESGYIVGLEMVDAAARLHKHPNILENPTFVRKIVDKYARRALASTRVR